jgi:hypothetical protein
MENDNSELCLSLFVDRGESKKILWQFMCLNTRHKSMDDPQMTTSQDSS